MIGTIVGTHYAANKGASWGKAALIGIGIDFAIGVAIIGVPMMIGAAAGAGMIGAGAGEAVIPALEGLGGLNNATRLGARAANAVAYRHGSVLPAGAQVLGGTGFGRCAGC